MAQTKAAIDSNRREENRKTKSYMDGRHQGCNGRKRSGRTVDG
jgi:hypothetical protein